MLDNPIIISLLGFIFLISPIVFVHELGHYLAAIKNKIDVEVFSIGFGWELFGFNDKNSTRWKFCILPFGGYVKMKGEQLVDRSNNSTSLKYSGKFNHASLMSRFIILLSGPIANLIFGVIVLSLIFSFSGRVSQYAVIDKVFENQPAYIAGFKQNDRIRSVNDNQINSFYDFKDLIEKSSGKTLKVEVTRNNENLYLFVKPKKTFDKEKNVSYGRIGISAKINSSKNKLNPIESLYYSFYDTFLLTTLILKKIVSADFTKNDIAGPVGIAQISGKALSSSLESFIVLAAMMSINLGILNLLPVPPLDGGHITFYLYNLILRKPLPIKFQIFFTNIGIFLLIMLMIFVFYIDLNRNLFD